MNVAVITTSRADWGALGMVARALRKVGHVVRVMVASHHDGQRSIADDGFDGWTFDCWQTAGPAIGGLTAWRPDWALVLGDRWETLLVAFACKYAGVPLAHLAGGDVTEGSPDNAYRNAISMLASLHFPTNQPAADRLIAMGIDPATVHMVGSAAIDRIRATPLMGREELCGELGLSGGPFVLANWQPDGDNAGLLAIFDAFASLKTSALEWSVGPLNEDNDVVLDHVEVAWATPGADPGQDQVTGIITERSGKPPRAMSPAIYLSAMTHCALMIGNSSSGFYEAPYFGTPVIDVGDRQKGRFTPPNGNVRTVEADAAKIADALPHHFGAHYFGGTIYGDGHAAERIAEVMAHV